MQIALFVIGSCFLVWFSRHSLLRPRSHGFARFFAFELLLALGVINAPAWFRDPFGAWQLASWVLLFASAALAIHAFHVFHREGRHLATGHGADYAWERTTALITSGAYRYIRHPMYASLMLLAAGAVLKAISPQTVLLGIGAIGALVCTALADERETAARFGAAYERYRGRTRMFVPWLI